MQLSAFESIKLGFFKLPDASDLQPTKNCSVDLTIGLILRKAGNGEIVEETAAYTMKPQETVFLISEEEIHIKDHHTAYVFLKNRLSRQGILAINTGIVDEGYNGPISTLATNLSSNHIDIETGTEFFRVVIHQFGQNAHEPRIETERKPVPRKRYVEFRKHELRKFPNSFMDREQLKSEINEEVSKATLPLSIRNLTIAISIIGILLGIFTIFAPHLQSYVSVPSGQEITKALNGIVSIEKQQNLIGKEIDESKIEVSDLRQEVNTLTMSLASKEASINALEARLKAIENTIPVAPRKD